MWVPRDARKLEESLMLSLFNSVVEMILNCMASLKITPAELLPFAVDVNSVLSWNRGLTSGALSNQ